MRFSMARFSLMAVALLLPIYVQAVAFTVDSFKGIAVGQPKILTWSGDNTPVTIKLMQGPPEALETVVTLASNVAGEQYSWTPTTLASGTYVLSIIQGSETNYSPQFSLDNAPPPGAPIRAGTKPPTAATAALALPGTTHPTKPPTAATAALALPGTTHPTKPPTKAKAALALPEATHHVLPSAAIAAYYYPAAGYISGSRTICESTDDNGSSTSAAFPCASSVKPALGHYQNSAAGIEKRNAAVGAAVVGLAFAVLLVL